MADSNIKKRTFEIEIAGVKESVTNLESLEQVLDKMEKQVESINKNGGFSVVSKEANKNTKEAIDLAKAEQIAQGDVISSYKDKQAAMRTLGKEIKSMTVADDEATRKQQEMIQQYNGLNDQLKRFDAAMGNHQRNVGDYRGALKEATSELKSMKGEMVGLDQNSERFKELAKQAGATADKIGDINAAIKRHASDTKVLDDVINVAQSATAAFQLYKGAMSAFGIETEGAEEAMQKLLGAMNIVQSLQTLSETLQSSSATAQIFQKAMKMLGLEFLTTGTNAGTAAASTTALATAENGAAVATNTLSTASKALRIALASIGIGIIIGLVAILIEHWEDLCGWFDRTFPIVKKLGGVFNALKATFMGFGKAILNWVVNPLKTMATVIQKILQGDFAGAMSAVAEGIKNQFTGTAKAFKEGFQTQVEKGLEEITRKNAAEQDKMLTHNKNMITKQKNADGTYRKEYIEANKKMFDNRKKMYKKDSDEYRKVLEEEAAFNQQIEDAKTTATKNSAKERAKAEKEAAKAAKDAAKEAAEAAKLEAEELKRLVTARRELSDAWNDAEIQDLKNQERIKQRELEKYALGPLDKYIEKLIELRKVQQDILKLENTKTVDSIGNRLEDSLKSLNKANQTWQKYQDETFETYRKHLIDEEKKTYGEASALALKYAVQTSNVWKQMFLSFSEEIQKFNKEGKIEEGFKHVQNVIKSLGLNDADVAIVEKGWEDVLNVILKMVDKANENIIDDDNKLLAARKAVISEYADDFERRYKKLIDTVTKEEDLEKVKRNPIWGTIQTQKTEESLALLKQYWLKAEIDLNTLTNNMKTSWEKYLEEVKKIYGEDSNAYKKALKDKEDAFENFNNKMTEVQKRTKTPLSTETDYTGDNQASGSTKPNRQLWYGKGEKDKQGKEYSLIDNLANLFDSLDEMVLAPAMDTFSMFMDFAIEETQQRLEEVEKMHDDALDKLEDSADKIRELNESLKDSNNTNLEATKQQLADEQLLYAQRLSEERKLAEAEKSLRNKAAQQEANARKMELRYQMVMAIANTAQGASKALGEWGWPLGPIFAGVMAALGAVQVGLIAKQIGAIKPIKYAEGGLIEGPSHKQGGIRIPNTNIEVEGNEFVVNKRSTKKYLPLLEAINADKKEYVINRSSTNRNESYETTNKVVRMYSEGGLLDIGDSQDSIQIGRTGIEVDRSELVVDRRSTVNYIPLFEAVNVESRKSIANTDKRIRKFANGGTMNFDRVDDNLKANNETNRLLNAIDGIDMQPVVAVKDIWKVEDRLVKVRSLAGK